MVTYESEKDKRYALLLKESKTLTNPKSAADAIVTPDAGKLVELIEVKDMGNKNQAANVEH